MQGHWVHLEKKTGGASGLDKRMTHLKQRAGFFQMTPDEAKGDTVRSTRLVPKNKVIHCG